MLSSEDRIKEDGTSFHLDVAVMRPSRRSAVAATVGRPAGSACAFGARIGADLPKGTLIQPSLARRVSKKCVMSVSC